MECEVCHRTLSNSHKPFTQASLRQHIRDAHGPLGGRQEEDNPFELTNMIADKDMPDGAYFALAWELGEL